MITKDSLRGYVFEEVLAKLFQRSGFDLLVSADQDPSALIAGSNGLRIRGRGANHQVDVLGQLATPIPFMFPLRLFIEAKFKSTKIGILEVRNAVGVLNDVNEHYSTAIATKRYKRYDYRYLLVSASGFTKDAELYSIAQRVSLIDFSGPAFADITQHIDRITDSLYTLAMTTRLSSFPVEQMREAMRKAFATWTLDDLGSPETLDDATARAMRSTTPGGLPRDELAAIAAEAAEFDDDLYFVFADTPFVNVARPDDPTRAERFERQGAARLAFAGSAASRGDWTIVEDEASGTNLRFATSPTLGLLLNEGDADAVTKKHRKALNSVSLSVDSTLRDVEFSPLPEELDIKRVATRNERLEPRLAVNAKDRIPQSTGDWSSAAIEALINRLTREGNEAYVTILAAAASNGGSIPREGVYAIFGYPPGRMLRGFTRPPRRITKDLISEGLLPEGVPAPLEAVYDHGVMASSFTVPLDFVPYFSRETD